MLALCPARPLLLRSPCPWRAACTLSPLPVLASQEERYTLGHLCHHSRALRPQRDMGRTSHGAVWFPPDCRPARSPHLRRWQRLGTAARALSWGPHVGLALLPWEHPGAIYPSSAVCPRAALTQVPQPCLCLPAAMPRGHTAACLHTLPCPWYYHHHYRTNRLDSPPATH